MELLYLFIWIIGFIISVFIARWAFRINEIVKIQKKQLYILTMLARQQGVPGEALDYILGDAADNLSRKYLTGVDPNAKYQNK